MIETNKISNIKARFLSNGEIDEIRSLSVVSEGNKNRLYFELFSDNSNRKHFYYVPLFPNSPIQINDIILPDQVVLITIDNYTDCYAWRLGDKFPIEFSSNDPYTNRILKGQFDREGYYNEKEEEKRKRGEKRQEEIGRQEKEKLNRKESWANDKLPIIIGMLFGVLVLVAIIYYGAIKQAKGFVEIFCCLIFALFLISLFLLCKRIWKKLNVYSIGFCLAASITLSVFTIRGINKMVNGDVHISHYHNNSKHSSLSNNGTIGVDPFPNENVDVYITRYGNCYHSTRNCFEVTKSKHISKISKKKARKRHYVPCSVCYGTY